MFTVHFFVDNSWASSGRNSDSEVHVPDKYGWCEHDDDQCNPAQDWGQHADRVSQGTPPLSYSKCCVPTHAFITGQRTGEYVVSIKVTSEAILENLTYGIEQIYSRIKIKSI